MGTALSQPHRTDPAAAVGPAGRRWQRAAQALTWLVGTALATLYFRLRVENRPRLRGAYVLVANHTSFLDPLILSAAHRGWVSYLMSDVFYRSPRLRWFYRLADAIPVSGRGGNRNAIRAARAVLERGGVVGVFPEGGLARDGLPYLGEPGAVSLVLSVNVAVVPVGIIGADRAMPPHGGLPRPRRVVVRFGTPIPPQELVDAAESNRKLRLQIATDRVMGEIALLCRQTPRAAELDAAR